MGKVLYHNISRKTSDIARVVAIELPQFFNIKKYDMNFIYCDIPTKMKISPWTLTLFTDPFDNSTWILLSASSLATLLYLKKDAPDSEIVQIVLSLVASALLFCTQGHFVRTSVFLLWMGASLILVNFYTASITSTLISPPQDDLMTKISHLVDRNCTMLDANFHNTKIINIAALVMKSSSPTKRALLAIMQRYYTNQANERLYQLLSNKKTFMFLSWENVLSLMQERNFEIRRTSKTEARKHKKYEDAT